MSLFNLFDLHCDTISECLDHGHHLKTNPLHIDLDRFCGNDWVQTFAFFIHDKYRGEAAFDRFLQQYNLFCSELEQNSDALRLYDQTSHGGCNAILSVEGGHVLGGDITKIAELKKRNIRFLTLVWNADNELGCPPQGSPMGLTPFGKQCIPELEKNGITVDVSHLNEQGFNDVAALSAKPFIATHSNAYAVCANQRNLKDYQIKCLIECKGLCGINLYTQFVNSTNDCTMTEIMRHMEHILSLGGEDILAIGTDFDGANMPSCVAKIEHIGSLYEETCRNFGKMQADKIFFENARNFLAK